MTRTSLAAIALMSLAFAAPALAQDNMMMKDNMGMMMSPKGEMTMMSTPMDQATMDMAMKNAQPVPEGTIFFMSGGKMYMVQDMKMENGMMMSDGMMKK